jgi:hypothetical protein
MHNNYPMRVWTHSAGFHVVQMDDDVFDLIGIEFGYIGEFKDVETAKSYAWEEFIC